MGFEAKRRIHELHRLHTITEGFQRTNIEKFSALHVNSDVSGEYMNHKDKTAHLSERACSETGDLVGLVWGFRSGVSSFNVPRCSTCDLPKLRMNGITRNCGTLP